MDIAGSMNITFNADISAHVSHCPAAAQAIAPAVPPGNPRPVTAAVLRRLLHAAWQGTDQTIMMSEEDSR